MRNIYMIFIMFIISITTNSFIFGEDTYLIVAQENYAPFQYFDESGAPQGLDVEIIKKAAETAGIKIKIKLVPWARALDMVKTGKADGVFACGKTTDRLDFLYYPDTPVRYSRIVFFANEDFSGTINSLGDAKKYTVGVVNKYLISEEFDTTTTIQKEYANSSESLFLKLSNHRHALAAHNRIAGWHVIKHLKIANIRALPYIIASYPSYLAFSKNSPKGKSGYEKFSKALKSISEDGTVDQIMKKYIPEE